MYLHFDRFPEKIEKSPDAESTTNRQLSSRRVDLTKQKLQTNFIRVGHSIKLFVFCLEIIWKIIKTIHQNNKIVEVPLKELGEEKGVAKQKGPSAKEEKYCEERHKRCEGKEVLV